MHRLLTFLVLFGTFGTVPSPLHPPADSLPPITPPPPSLASSSLSAVSASGILVLDVQSGEVIMSRFAETRRPLASLVKIMTAVLILERFPLEEIVEVPPDVGTADGTTVGLRPGEKYTVHDLLAALLIASGNDAAEALALHYADTVEEFVKAMNVRARVLGLGDTTFKNPAGLDAPGQLSTPRDLAWLTSYALRDSVFRELVQSPARRIREKESGRMLDLVNTNRLLRAFPFVKGVKTGTTDEAGECLISLVELNGREVIVVLLKSSNRYRDSQIVFRELSQVLL